jgi:hypothetical protein
MTSWLLAPSALSLAGANMSRSGPSSIAGTTKLCGPWARIKAYCGEKLDVRRWLIGLVVIASIAGLAVINQLSAPTTADKVKSACKSYSAYGVLTSDPKADEAETAASERSLRKKAEGLRSMDSSRPLGVDILEVLGPDLSTDEAADAFLSDHETPRRLSAAEREKARAQHQALLDRITAACS